MRGLQGTFCRLKSRLTSNHIKRKRILIAVTLPHNYRVERDGINQIKKVFDIEYRRYCNIDGYDRIRNYFNS